MKKTILLLLIILVCNSLFAINLDEAKKMAEENNKYFLSQKANLNQAKWYELNSLTNLLPKFSLNETVVRSDDNTYNMANQFSASPYYIPLVDDQGNPAPFPLPLSAMSGSIYKTTYTSQLTIQQPIFNGGKILIGYQIAKLAKKQA